MKFKTGKKFIKEESGKLKNVKTAGNGKRTRITRSKSC
jgi:hypothetical protein